MKPDNEDFDDFEPLECEKCYKLETNYGFVCDFLQDNKIYAPFYGIECSASKDAPPK